MRTPVLFVAVSCSMLCLTMQAQYLGDNLRGDVGLKAGTQPGPGIYVTLPLFYHNDYTGLRNAQGDELLRNLNLNINFFTVPAVAMTTRLKIGGANYGFQVVPAVLNQVLTVASTGAQPSSGYGFTDLFVQPINLGWHTPRGDFLAAYGFFAPAGGTSHGLDMWAHELTAGTTIYPDRGKKWNVSTAAAFDINQRKRSQSIRVGDILTLEGGVGRSFLKGAANAGLAYVAQWKVTHDKGSDIPAILPITNGRAFGLGPEISTPVFVKGKTIVLVGFRYIWEMGNRTNFEGQTLIASITIARLMPGVQK